MEKQEISHQQVMSYLIGGGNTYTSHTFHSFCFHKVLQLLKDLQPHELDETVEDDGDQQIQGQDEHEIIVDVSSGRPVVVSDMLDYEMCYVQSLFNEMNLWEFGVLQIFDAAVSLLAISTQT